MSPFLKKYLQAVFLQFSGIMGAGIFALPYVFYRSNFPFALIGLIFLTVVTALLNHFYVEIILATKGDHQLSGYANLYLGKNFKLLTLLNVIVLGVGILLAYTKLSSSFLPVLFPFLPPFACQLIFIFFILFFHLNSAKNFNLSLQFLPIASIIIVFFLFFYSLINPGFSPPPVDNNFFYFGAAVFALAGFTVIPEVEEILRGSKDIKLLLNSASLSGLLLVSFVYILFFYAVIRLSGPLLSVDSVSGIAAAAPLIGKLLAVFGLINIFKASLNMLLVLKEYFFRDFGIRKNLSYLLSSLVPLSIFFFASTSFVQIISVTGSITVFISALIICLIRLKISPGLLIKILIAFTLLVLALGVYFEFAVSG